MSAKEITTAANRGAIRVTLPVSVAYDLDRFQKALANVAARLECAGQTSGTTMPVRAIREFVVDPESLQVKEAERIAGGP